MKIFNILFLLLCIHFTAKSQTWGDQGDGTYRNPVLLADYSDPDVIRVGKKYYMTCSEFHFMGMPILESTDLVNWKIVGQIFRSLPLERFDRMEGYGDGTWAPALRYHDGRFWMFVCMPHTGLYMSTAIKPEGPWTPLHQVKEADGWEDPCPFWDEDGSAYLGRSQLGGGPIILHRMSPDGHQLLDEGKIIYEGPTAEGTKFFKRDGFYYLSIPEGGVSTGWQTVLRSSSIYGPYEGKRVLEQGSTDVNGPHQGALVDTPDGDWWFLHFQSHSPQGRVLHLQPVQWQADGFPVIGRYNEKDGICEPVASFRKPVRKGRPHLPETSDSFDGKQLGLQWAWNHNPLDSHWSLTRRRKWLSLCAQQAENVRSARNTLTQKTMGYAGKAEVTLDFSDMLDGQRAGLACLGSSRCAIGIEATATTAGKLCYSIYSEKDGEVVRYNTAEGTSKNLLRLCLDIDAAGNKHQFSYSTDGKNYHPVGPPFPQGDSDWKGARVALFSYSTGKTGGWAHFDDFIYEIKE